MHKRMPKLLSFVDVDKYFLLFYNPFVYLYIYFALDVNFLWKSGVTKAKRGLYIADCLQAN